MNELTYRRALAELLFPATVRTARGGRSQPSGGLYRKGL